MNLRSLFCPAALVIVALCTFCIPALAYSPAAVQWYDQGTAAIAAGNNVAAIQSFDEAVSQDSSYYEAWDGKADALNREGQFSDALSASDKALAINPGYVKGWINRGQILYNIGYVYEDQKNDLTKANEYYYQQLLAFEKAITLDPTNADAWFNKGYALAGMKRYDEALASFDKVKELNADYPKIDQNRQIAQQLKDQSNSIIGKDVTIGESDTVKPINPESSTVAQNEKIVQQLKDQVTPDYLKFLPVIVMVVVVIIGIVIWSVFLREKKEE